MPPLSPKGEHSRGPMMRRITGIRSQTSTPTKEPALFDTYRRKFGRECLSKIRIERFPTEKVRLLPTPNPIPSARAKEANHCEWLGYDGFEQPVGCALLLRPDCELGGRWKPNFGRPLQRKGNFFPILLKLELRLRSVWCLAHFNGKYQIERIKKACRSFIYCLRTHK